MDFWFSIKEIPLVSFLLNSTRIPSLKANIQKETEQQKEEPESLEYGDKLGVIRR